jgi:2-keto-4-pentenoate hydratase
MTSPMTVHHARAAAQLLWRHRQAGTTVDALPQDLRPAGLADGHAIQAALPEVSGDAVAGWKIAATSAAGQAHIHVSGPLPGRILRGFVSPIGQPVSLWGNRMRVVEPEFAFRFGQALAPLARPREVAEVMQAVEALLPAFEVPDSRYTDFTVAGHAQLLADDACCGRFVFGAGAPAGWRALDLAAHRVQATVRASDGTQRLVREGEGRAALGDPRVALTWLVNELNAIGLTLHAGEVVSTGTCMVPVPVAPGDTVEADYGVLGRLALTLQGA